MNITYSLSEKPLPVSIEWRWTGFTPASLLLQDDMKQTLRYLAAIPRQGVRYVRIHNLLELVTAKGLGSDTPVYDWSKLDEGLDALVENRLIPFFELMGNPSRYFNDFQDRGQAEAWKRLVRDLALHVQDRYGRGEVEQWYFETWNEPDCGWWHQSVENFIIYYDACSEGLKEANPEHIALGSLGSIRLNRATLLTHDGRSLPMTARARHDAAGTIQNNGHLVFEGEGASRWEVRTRPQTYAGAIWIHSDVTLDLHRDLTHTGTTEAPDEPFDYIAANAFQTLRDRHTRADPIHITKTGTAALILAGEQAYAEDSHLHIRQGTVLFQSDPFAGRTFPRGDPQAAPHLSLHIHPEGRAVFDTPTFHLADFQMENGATAEWRQPVTIHATQAVRLDRIHIPGSPTASITLLRAPAIQGRPQLHETSGVLRILDTHDGQQILIFEPLE